MRTTGNILKIVALLVCGCVLFCSCSQQAPLTEPTEEASKCSINWNDDVTLKYINNDKVNQLVTVQVTEGTHAKITLLEKSKVNGKNVWTNALSCDGYVGVNGIGVAKEGACITPIGDFEITTAFGIKENPGTKLPYIDVTDDTYCCGDDDYYNKIIDISKYPHECNGEHMIEYTPQYNYGFFFDYNKECKKGDGFAYFFHCTGLKEYTGGCIAVNEENMVKILKSVNKGARLIINYIG